MLQVTNNLRVSTRLSRESLKAIESRRRRGSDKAADKAEGRRSNTDLGNSIRGDGRAAI